MTIRWRRQGVKAAVALAAALPLLTLVLWAYEPALPYAYPDVTELLLSVYQSAATPLERSAFIARLCGAMLLALLALAVLLIRAENLYLSMLCGVLASSILTQPILVSWILAAEEFLPFISTVLACLFLSFLLIEVTRRLPAAAAPIAILCLLLGVSATVRTAGDIVVRSEPALFVLYNGAERPNDPEAQLALGMYLLSIGGECESVPYLSRAGETLAARFTAEEEAELRSVALYLAELPRSPDTFASKCINQPEESNP